MMLTAFGCGTKEFQPQTGDLLFQVGSTGDMTQAIALSTGDGHDVPYTHVAIVVIEPDGTYALEASGKKGVVMTPLAEFLSGSATLNDRPVVAVGRLRSPERKHLVGQAISRAKTFLGQPYDNSFLPDNEKMYCSELVWESFRDDNGPILEARPMNFRAPDGTMPPYWTEHFAALGEPIPEGVHGTNPDDMSRDQAIVIVHRY